MGISDRRQYLAHHMTLAILAWRLKVAGAKPDLATSREVKLRKLVATGFMAHICQW
ncbi:MAG: hypothetical protein ACHP8A_14430 [Terriglobales bacterium]|jgi:hypothetical protein